MSPNLAANSHFQETSGRAHRPLLCHSRRVVSQSSHAVQNDHIYSSTLQDEYKYPRGWALNWFSTSIPPIPPPSTKHVYHLHPVLNWPSPSTETREPEVHDPPVATRVSHSILATHKLHYRRRYRSTATPYTRVPSTTPNDDISSGAVNLVQFFKLAFNSLIRPQTFRKCFVCGDDHISANDFYVKHIKPIQLKLLPGSWEHLSVSEILLVLHHTCTHGKLEVPISHRTSDWRCRLKEEFRHFTTRHDTWNPDGPATPPDASRYPLIAAATVALARRSLPEDCRRILQELGGIVVMGNPLRSPGAPERLPSFATGCDDLPSFFKGEMKHFDSQREWFCQQQTPYSTLPNHECFVCLSGPLLRTNELAGHIYTEHIQPAQAKLLSSDSPDSLSDLQLTLLFHDTCKLGKYPIAYCGPRTALHFQFLEEMPRFKAAHRSFSPSQPIVRPNPVDYPAIYALTVELAMKKLENAWSLQEVIRRGRADEWYTRQISVVSEDMSLGRVDIERTFEEVWAEIKQVQATSEWTENVRIARSAPSAPGVQQNDGGGKGICCVEARRPCDESSCFRESSELGTPSAE